MKYLLLIMITILLAGCDGNNNSLSNKYKYRVLTGNSTMYTNSLEVTNNCMTGVSSMDRPMTTCGAFRIYTN